VKQAVGYRLWRPDDKWLVSPFRPTVWPYSTWLQAVCLESPTDFPQGPLPKAHRQEPWAAPPVARCGCGIYAYHDAANMLGALDEHAIGGAVLCWGRITIHPEGIRAQYARPIALCRPEAWRNARLSQPILQRIADGYGIPLLESRHLVSYAGEFGDSYRPGAGDAPATAGDRLSQAMRKLLRRLIDV
jgi:hypothetical protein